MKNIKVLLIALFLLSIGFAGCSSTRSRIYSSSPPDWIGKGSGAFETGDQRVFYGVGAISGVKSEPLARKAAGNRATAEIASTFELYSATLMKDYSASTTAGARVDSEGSTAEEQHIEQSIKTFSAVTLNGVVIIDNWVDPSDGTVYALAKLDLNKFTDSLDSIKGLNNRVRDFVRSNAEKTFDSLEAEEAKAR